MTKNKICGIYCIENILNNKKYIGQSVDINKRWYEHKRTLNLNSHDNIHLQRAWNKYGDEYFNFFILEECQENELNEKEKGYIFLYNTTDLSFGYNMTLGGDGSHGYTHTLETRKKISVIQKGVPLSEKNKESLKKTWKKKIDDGYMPLIDHLQPYVEAQRKAIHCYDRDTGEKLCSYDSIHDAARELGVEATNICKVLQGKHRYCLDYYFTYVNELLNAKEVIFRSNKQPIYEVDKAGKILCLYPSIKVAANVLNLDPKLISGVCVGRHKTTGGRYFRYA